MSSQMHSKTDFRFQKDELCYIHFFSRNTRGKTTPKSNLSSLEKEVVEAETRANRLRAQRKDWV